jgi:hypothetical protein
LVAQATTKPYHYSYQPTTITINTHKVGTPAHINALDSLTGNNTSIAYIPVYTLEQLLPDMGVLVDWNHNVMNLQVPYPLHLPSSPKAMPISTHTLLIEENGHPVLYAPEIQYPMEGSKVNTAYVAIPYVDTALNTFAKSVTWDGTNWTMNTQFPDGWVPPVLTESWSPALAANYQTGAFALFQKELGFDNGGNDFTLPAIGNAIIVGDGFAGGNDQKQVVEVEMIYAAWGPSTYEESQNQNLNYPTSYRIPIVSIQLDKFYFGSHWRQFWNYQAYGKDNIIYTIGNRQVQTVYRQGTYDTAISKPGETLYGKPLKG